MDPEIRRLLSEAERYRKQAGFWMKMSIAFATVAVVAQLAALIARLAAR